MIPTVSISFTQAFLNALQLTSDVINCTWRCCWRLKFPIVYILHMQYQYSLVLQALVGSNYIRFNRNSNAHLQGTCLLIRACCYPPRKPESWLFWSRSYLALLQSHLRLTPLLQWLFAGPTCKLKLFKYSARAILFLYSKSGHGILLTETSTMLTCHCEIILLQIYHRCCARTITAHCEELWVSSKLLVIVVPEKHSRWSEANRVWFLTCEQWPRRI